MMWRLSNVLNLLTKHEISRRQSSKHNGKIRHKQKQYNMFLNTQGI